MRIVGSIPMLAIRRRHGGRWQGLRQSVGLVLQVQAWLVRRERSDCSLTMRRDVCRTRSHSPVLNDASWCAFRIVRCVAIRPAC